MKLQHTIFLFLLASVFPLIAQAQVITGFGTGQFTTTYTDFTTINQTATTLHVQGVDNNGLIGTIPTVTIPVSTTKLSLTGTLGGVNPMSTFTITLMDSADQSIDFHGDWSSFSISGASMTGIVDLVSPGAFNGSVVGIAFYTGSSVTAVDFTFDQLAAVPEATAWHLLVVASAVLLLLGKVRRHSEIHRG